MVAHAQQEFSIEKLTEIITSHWRKHLPKMYAQLQAEGTLQERIKQVANDTRQVMEQLIGEGYSEFTAWQETRTEYAILPAE